MQCPLLMVEEVKHSKWWQNRTFWVIAGILIVGGALAVPAYRAVKDWRAENLAGEARTLLEKEGEEALVAAWEKANSAYYLAPGNVDVVRALAEVYSKADPAQALNYWERAAELSSGDPADRIGLARAALEMGALGEVKAQLEFLEEEGYAGLDAVKIKAGYLAKQRKHEEALKTLEPWIQGDDADEAAHSLYLQISLASRDSRLRERGLEHILFLARRDDELGLKAIRLLLPLQEKDEELISFLERRLREHPTVGREELLNWISWKLRAGIEERSVAYGKVIPLFDLDDIQDLVSFTRWLNQNGFSNRVTTFVTLEKAKRRKDLFLIFMDALAMQGRWDEIRRILESESIPLEDYLKQVFLARSYYETGMDRRASLGWQKVRLEIANDPEKLGFFANYARRLQLFDEARETYRRMTEISISKRKGYVQWIALERRLGDTEKLWTALKAMHEAYPDDVAVENDMLYTQFLLGKDIEEGLENARKLVEKNPNFLSHRITLALGYLKQDRPEAALAVFESLDIPLDELSPSFRTVLGVVLRRNGKDEEAGASFRGVDTRKLLAEEAALFQEYARR